MKNLTLFTLLLSLFACKRKEESIYAGCCGTEPSTYVLDVKTQALVDTGWVDTILPAYVYFPNVFIPVREVAGLDDNFVIYSSEGVDFILSVVISGDNGEVLYSKDSISTNYPDEGWNGIKPDGSYYFGPFSYEAKIKYVDGQIKTYTGRSCSYKCGDSGFPTERLPDCYFPNQNENGQWNPNKPYTKMCF